MTLTSTSKGHKNSQKAGTRNSVNYFKKIHKSPNPKESNENHTSSCSLTCGDQWASISRRYVDRPTRTAARAKKRDTYETSKEKPAKKNQWKPVEIPGISISKCYWKVGKNSAHCSVSTIDITTTKARTWNLTKTDQKHIHPEKKLRKLEGRKKPSKCQELSSGIVWRATRIFEEVVLMSTSRGCEGGKLEWRRVLVEFSQTRVWNEISASTYPVRWVLPKNLDCLRGDHVADNRWSDMWGKPRPQNSGSSCLTPVCSTVQLIGKFAFAIRLKKCLCLYTMSPKLYQHLRCHMVPFLFVLHLLLIRLITQQNLRCICISTRKHLQQSDWKSDLPLFSYGYRKSLFVDIGPPNCVHYWVKSSYDYLKT